MLGKVIVKPAACPYIPPVERRVSMNMKKTQAGFTLIELLVVITIIGILAGLLLPAIFSSQQKGWQAGCKANMKNISTALHSWINDHNGWLPPGENGRDGNYGLWCNQTPDYITGDKYHLSTYLGTFLGMPPICGTRLIIPQFVCPAFRRHGANYNMSGRVVYARTTGVTWPAGFDPFGYPPGSGADKPPQKLEAVGALMSLSSVWTLADTDLLAFSSDTWGESGGLPDQPSHVSQRNYVYFDGHVAAKDVPADGKL